MNTQHSQSPWKWDGSKIRDNANQKVWFTLSDLRSNPNQVQANAKLIAAAPELLEALKSIVSEHGFNTSSSLKRDALEAIKKATL